MRKRRRRRAAGHVAVPTPRRTGWLRRDGTLRKWPVTLHRVRGVMFKPRVGKHRGIWAEPRVTWLPSHAGKYRKTWGTELGLARSKSPRVVGAGMDKITAPRMDGIGVWTERRAGRVTMRLTGAGVRSGRNVVESVRAVLRLGTAGGRISAVARIVPNLGGWGETREAPWCCLERPGNGLFRLKSEEDRSPRNPHPRRNSQKK